MCSIALAGQAGGKIRDGTYTGGLSQLLCLLRNLSKKTWVLQHVLLKPGYHASVVV